MESSAVIEVVDIVIHQNEINCRRHSIRRFRDSTIQGWGIQGWGIRGWGIQDQWL